MEYQHKLRSTINPKNLRRYVETFLKYWTIRFFLFRFTYYLLKESQNDWLYISSSLLLFSLYLYSLSEPESSAEGLYLLQCIYVSLFSSICYVIKLPVVRSPYETGHRLSVSRRSRKGFLKTKGVGWLGGEEDDVGGENDIKKKRIRGGLSNILFSCWLHSGCKPAATMT